MAGNWVTTGLYPSLDYKRKRKPKENRRERGRTRGLRQRPDEVWTEGSF